MGERMYISKWMLETIVFPLIGVIWYMLNSKINGVKDKIKEVEKKNSSGFHMLNNGAGDIKTTVSNHSIMISNIGESLKAIQQSIKHLEDVFEKNNTALAQLEVLIKGKE